MPRLLFALGWLALMAGLVLPTVQPEVANTTILALMGVGLLTMLFDRQARSALRQPAIVTLMAAGVLLFLALIPTAESPQQVLLVFVLAPLWFCGMLLPLFARLGDRATLTVIGLLALLATVGAAGVAAYDIYVLGRHRGGFSVNNPIHLADLALTLGFVSLVALYGPGRWRWLGLLGPALALAAIILSGSRGPLVAFMMVAVIAGPFLLFTLVRLRGWTNGVVVAAAVLGLAISPFIEVDLGRRTFSIVAFVTDLADDGPSDKSSLQRAYMLQSAWGAFQASPVYGHGIADYTRKAAQYAPPDNPFRPSGHLHNDIADFAVIGGIMGLVSYLLILLAPLVGAWRAANRERRPALLLLALTMSVGYFGMGLTNAMFGVLTQTVLYAVLVALLSHMASRTEMPNARTAA